MIKSTCSSLVLAVSVLAAACAAPADGADTSASGGSAFSSTSSSDGDFCKSEFAKWRLEQAHIAGLSGITADDRTLLANATWDTGTTIALACVGLRQTADIPADVAAHALAGAQKNCDDTRAAIEKQIAAIDTLTPAEATEEQKDQFRAAGQQRLVDAQKGCESDLALYEKMGK